MSIGPGVTPTSRYLAVLEAAMESARRMGHQYVGVEHLFLAIIRDQDSAPAQLLNSIARLSEMSEIENGLRRAMEPAGYTNI